MSHLNMIQLVVITLLWTCGNPSPLDKSYSNIGLSVEVEGQIMMSSDVISIPAVLSMNWVKSLFNESVTLTQCERTSKDLYNKVRSEILDALDYNLGTILSKSETQAYQDKLCEHEPDFCYLTNSTSRLRNKRFIFTAGAALGAGMGAFGYWLYDKIAGNSATEAIKTLKDHHNVLVEKVNMQDQAILRISATLKELWSVAIQAKEEITRLKTRYTCLEDETHIITKTLPYISIIPNQFHRAINDLLRGKVSPDLISYNQLKEFLKNTIQFEDTVYREEGALFYQLSHSIPVEVDLSQHLITFLIQVPKITFESTGILYKLNNFGVHLKNIATRVRLPDYIARFRMPDRSTMYSTITETQCEKSPGLWLCGQSAFDFSYNPHCIIGILKDNSTLKCSLESRLNYIDPDILVTKSVVFYHSETVTTTFFNITGGGKSSRLELPHENKTRMVALSTFDTMVVGAYHIEGHRRAQFTSPIMAAADGLNLESTIDPSYLDDNGWKDLEGIEGHMQALEKIVHQSIHTEIHPLSLPMLKSSTISIVASILLVLSLITCAMVGYRKYMKYQYQKKIKLETLKKMSELEEQYQIMK
ncbi:MAG: hypothetical protein QKV07_gp1 [Guiyang lispivirus 2]|uniref:Glycoprotein n=1 Tax=Guiyang lispivirus 2 TaxID=2905571 RepID=A0AAX2ZNI3_9MONO|nr:MAG: hypothetical protein QKV07_gp1 [Guiyang lispivirus 2]UHK03041.1 MAG: hypothetical protein GuLV2_gp1 [Guiyang lispivirus 2]